jgi:hypothetical protein
MFLALRTWSCRKISLSKYNGGEPKTKRGGEKDNILLARHHAPENPCCPAVDYENVTTARSRTQALTFPYAPNLTLMRRTAAGSRCHCVNHAEGQCDQSATIMERSALRIASLTLRLHPHENAAG